MFVSFSGDGKTIYITGSELKAKFNETFKSTLSTPTVPIKVFPS